MKRNAATLAALVGLALMGLSTSSWAARADGTEATFQKSVSAFSDGESIARFWTGNRTGLGDNTKWEWKWSKVYPEFTTYCSASAGCTANVTYSKAEAVATMIGVSFAGADKIAELTRTLTATFQKTFTTTSTYSFAQTASLTKGQNAYAGIIALQRQQINAPIGGRWDRVANSCKTTTNQGGSYTTCKYRWTNWPTQAGTWNGTQNTQHRTYLCTTTTVTTPSNGATLPSGCSKPGLPSGYYGG